MDYGMSRRQWPTMIIIALMVLARMNVDKLNDISLFTGIEYSVIPAF
jgi:hypothetical protein